MNKRSGMAKILLWSGLVLSAIAILIGLGCLLIGIFVLTASKPGYSATFVRAMIGWGFILGTVLWVPGILGLRACIRRLRGRWERSQGLEQDGILAGCGEASRRLK